MNLNLKKQIEPLINLIKNTRNAEKVYELIEQLEIILKIYLARNKHDSEIWILLALTIYQAPIHNIPDAEQYYNPRNRRWYFNSNFTFSLNQKTARSNTFATKNSSIGVFDVYHNIETSSYWLTFDKKLQYEIYYHYLMQSFHETFYYLNVHREMLDLFVFQLLRKGFLKELDCLMTISQFKNI